nr:alpha/beta fold hydrolase [Rubricoccus marinus]
MLALHGGLGWDSAALRPWLDPLAEHARLTYVDLLGCGSAPDPDDWSTVAHGTWAAGVEDVRQRLDEARGGHERVILFGHSYGGIIALEAALAYPERVAGLILCATPSAAAHIPAAVERAQARDLSADVRAALNAVLSAPPTSDAEFAALMPALLPLYAHAPDAHDFAAYAAGIRFRAAPCRRSFYELLGDYDARQRLAEIAAPTLVLSGRHDWVAAPADAHADFLAGLPLAEGHVFEHSGHLPFLEEPEAFVRVAGEWLERQASGAAD